MLKLRDLAVRSDFEIGPLTVSPSRRLIRGPVGESHVEPLVMQVFLLLLDADGRVVTRNTLFDECWGGAMIGDASLNRAILGVRRIAAEVAPGLFEIETIPRTGYRITGAILPLLQGAPVPESDDLSQPKVSRRTLVGTGAAAAVWPGRAHR